MTRAAAPTDVRFEHRTDPGPVLGLGTAAPRLSWVVPEAEPGWTQGAYEVEVTRAGGAPDVVRVDSGEQVLVPWPAAPLRSRERATVRVRVAHEGAWSAWSTPATAEAGLLSPQDWTADFISPVEIGRAGERAPVLARDFDLPHGTTGARLRATAHGLYVVTLNGQRVGDEHLAPGWTSYEHRLRYQTHDVTELVRPGPNRLEVLLGNGWYRGRLGFTGEAGKYGDRLALLAQLEVTTADGDLLVVGTDPQWSARPSAVVTDDLYDGQTTDLRRADDRGASSADSAGSAVEVIDASFERLVAPDGPPVRVTEVLPAQAVTSSPTGATIVDFGQNVVGWVRLRVRDAQPLVVVRHAEVLEHGELGVRPLRGAKATDTYLLGDAPPTGDEPGERVLEPQLTFHGFRYAEVVGVPDLRAEDVEAVVIGSDLRRTGWFSCSHPLLERFHENVVWAMRGNFVDVPTDCPQRDERLGWTGDAQVFSPTAGFLYDCAGFLTSWLADLAADQHDDGSVPFVVPDVVRSASPTAAAWGDAATVVPSVLHERFADTALLARQLPSMRAWVDRLDALAGEDHLWAGGFQFGDWLDPTAPPEDAAAAQADPDVVATAHLVRSADLLAAACRVVGDAEAARRYEAVAAAARAAFAHEYVTPAGRVTSDAPTVYALAIAWDLLPGPEQRHRAGELLADLVRTSGFHISTGFVGTPLMTDALTLTGHADVAYRLLLQTGCPSWLYAVTMGATTVWERWDSMLPDGSINPGSMTSFNHYALGAVADWMHRTVAGLAPGAPGYRHLLVHPVPGGGLTSAAARHLTPYGEASVAWERTGGELVLEVVVPVGASATVQVPGRGAPEEVQHGRHTWRVPDPLAGVAPQDGSPRLRAGARVRDVMDAAPLWDEVVAAAVVAGTAPGAAQVAGRLRPHLDVPAAGLVDALAPRDFSRGADVLHERLDPLLRAEGA